MRKGLHLNKRLVFIKNDNGDTCVLVSVRKVDAVPVILNKVLNFSYRDFEKKCNILFLKFILDNLKNN